jgi:DNA-binding NarL/FixJ family response regulator
LSVRILLVDDHAEVRHALGALLSASFTGASIGEAGAATEAVAAVGAGSWDLVLLDLSLPDRRGLEALRELRRLRPALPVLVMSFHPESDYAAAVRAEGAAGYVAKGSAPAVIVEAVRAALPRAQEA